VEHAGRAIVAALENAPKGFVVDPTYWTFAALASEVGQLLNWEWQPVGVPFQNPRTLWRAAPGSMTELVYRERLAQGDASGLLVLHHGRGADEHDLLPLADALDPQRRLHVVTPRAPLTLPGGPGYHWYLVPRLGYPD